jgi:hypothetical protein
VRRPIMSHFKPVSNTNRSTVCIICTHKYTNTNSSRYRHSAISVQKLFPKSQVMTATTYQETQIGTTPYAVLSAMNDENKTGCECKRKVSVLSRRVWAYCMG